MLIEETLLSAANTRMAMKEEANRANCNEIRRQKRLQSKGSTWQAAVGSSSSSLPEMHLHST
jgi:hypothetical protein